MKSFICSVLLGAAALLAAPHARGVVSIDYVTVGNAGNANDTTGFGGVASVFGIGKYEVTNAQYTEFLNMVDPAGGNSFSLYNANMSSSARGGINFNSGAAAGSKFSLKAGYDNRPVVYVSYLDAMRFANWLGNRQGSGSTETGAYTLASGGLAGRNPGATVWIPSENEWYKAAYHQPTAQGGDVDNYWIYPTGSNTEPNSRPGNSTDPNSANFKRDDSSPDDFLNDGYATTGSPVFNNAAPYLTNVGAYTQADSFYGTFDQGGNVFEWNDTVISSSRGLRGGSWDSFNFYLQPTDRDGYGSGLETDDIGFRLATVPEPTVAVSLMLGFVVMASLRKRPF